LSEKKKSKGVEERKKKSGSVDNRQRVRELVSKIISIRGTERGGVMKR